MKKNFILLISALVATLTSMTSCSEDVAQSSLPHIASLSFSPTSVEAGGECTGTLTFDKKGAYIQGHYRYTITPGDAVGYFRSTETNSLTFKFEAPSEPGFYTVVVDCTQMELYSGSQLNYLGSMKDIGSASSTFTVTVEE